MKASKLLMWVGFVITFHCGFLVNQQRDEIFDGSSSFNILTFPLEILAELLVGFVLVVIGTINYFNSFQEIYVNKQQGSKKLKYTIKPLVAPISTKGGLLNYYCEDHVSKIN